MSGVAEYYNTYPGSSFDYFAPISGTVSVYEDGWTDAALTDWISLGAPDAIGLFDIGPYPLAAYGGNATFDTVSYRETETLENQDGSVFGTFAVVPEPPAWALLALGFGALGVAARRRATPWRWKTA
jgi:hypothetical protein